MARGRPPKTDEDRLLEGARVLEVATLLRQGRLVTLAEMGFTTKEAAELYVSKRRYGLAGELIGKDAAPAAPSYTAGALRLVVEHGAPVQMAARLMYPAKYENGKPMFNVKLAPDGLVPPDRLIPPALKRRAARKDRGRETMDWRSVAQLIPQARREFDEGQARRADFAKNTTVVDVAAVRTIARQRVIQRIRAIYQRRRAAVRQRVVQNLRSNANPRQS